MILDSLSGQTLGQYQLRELLGVGGMGVVYRGYQESLEREVAIKITLTHFDKTDGQTSEQEARFAREARMAASLEHAHIVPVYDFGIENDISYVVMRLLNGGSLTDRILGSLKKGLLPPPEVARVTTALASALQYAHNRGVIHRDIKSSNVMFDDQNTPFLVDFGIAKMASVTTPITGTGVRIGTPEFMAPEQWLSEPLTPAVDQYALAILVYLMLTGKLPFKGEMPYQLMHCHLHDSPTPLTNWRSDLPESLTHVLDHALSKDPSARFPDIEAFSRAFGDIVEGAPLAIQPAKPIVETIILPSDSEVHPARRRGHRWIGLASAAAVALLIGGAAVLSASSNGTVAADDSPSPVASETTVALAQGAVLDPTATNTAIPTATDLPTATDTPTSVPTDTPTDAPSTTPVAVAMVSNPTTVTLPLKSILVGEHEVIEAEIACPLAACDAFDITIDFDPAIIQVEGVDVGPYLGEAVTVTRNLIDNAAGEIHLAATTRDADLVAEESILLSLNVAARQPGTSQLRVTQIEVTSSDGEPQYAVGVDGGIIVSGDTTEQATCQYRVQPGDTLSAIALANHVSIDQINALNEIPNASIIRVGQVLVIPASECHAPAPVTGGNDANGEIIAVYDCQYLGSNIFQWYSVRRTYDAQGNPVSDTRIGGPYSGAWQPGCPAASSTSPNNGGGSSNGGGSASSANTPNNSGGSGGSSESGGDSDGGGSSGGGGLGGLICTLLC